MKKCNYKKTIAYIAVVTIALAIPAFVVWKNIFPSFEYSSLGDDYLGVTLQQKKFGDTELMVLPELENYFFNEIIIKANSKKKPQEISAKVWKGFQAFQLAKARPIESKEKLLEFLSEEAPSEEFLNGQAFSYNGSVNVVSRGFYYPVFSADVFMRMGYRWEDVKEGNSELTSSLVKAEKMMYGQIHPDGTVLKNQGEYYLVWEEKLHPLKKEAAKTAESLDVSTVSFPGEAFEPFAQCDLEKRSGFYQCAIEKPQELPGSNYILQLPGIEMDELKETQVVLNSKFDLGSVRKNATTFLQKIKADLIKKYY